MQDRAESIDPRALKSAERAQRNPMFHEHALIGAREVTEGPRYEVRDPANEIVIASVSDWGVAEVSEAVELAAEAQRAWAQVLPKRRAPLEGLV